MSWITTPSSAERGDRQAVGRVGIPIAQVLHKCALRKSLMMGTISALWLSRQKWPPSIRTTLVSGRIFLNASAPGGTKMKSCLHPTARPEGRGFVR